MDYQKDFNRSNLPEKTKTDSIANHLSIYEVVEHYFFSLWRVKFEVKNQTKYRYRQLQEKWNKIENEIPILIEELIKANFNWDDILKITLRNVSKYIDSIK